MHKKKLLTIFASLLVMALLVTACAPDTVIKTVEVEVPGEPVEGELVTIVARCRAKPPTEDWRCNNLLASVAGVNQDLAAAGDTRRVVVETIQDNTDFGDIMQEFALAFEAGEAPDILLTGHEFIGTEAT
ncbi:MAG: hypothetical protein QGD88_11615, partial [Anaerolineae bacterium]|nr:hypothetical protein [Anaerolineae bacterium]